MIKGNKLSCEEEYFKSLSLYSLFPLWTLKKYTHGRKAVMSVHRKIRKQVV